MNFLLFIFDVVSLRALHAWYDTVKEPWRFLMFALVFTPLIIASQLASTFAEWLAPTGPMLWLAVTRYFYLYK